MVGKHELNKVLLTHPIGEGRGSIIARLYGIQNLQKIVGNYRSAIALRLPEDGRKLIGFL